MEKGGETINMNKSLIEITNKAIIEAKYALEIHYDPHLANYILRDLQIVKDAKLDDLSWAMHKEGCCENDVLGLIEHIENFIKKGGTHDLNSIGTSQARLRAGEGRQAT